MSIEGGMCLGEESATLEIVSSGGRSIWWLDTQHFALPFCLMVVAILLIYLIIWGANPPVLIVWHL